MFFFLHLQCCINGSYSATWNLQCAPNICENWQSKQTPSFRCVCFLYLQCCINSCWLPITVCVYCLCVNWQSKQTPSFRFSVLRHTCMALWLSTIRPVTQVTFTTSNNLIMSLCICQSTLPHTGEHLTEITKKPLNTHTQNCIHRGVYNNGAPWHLTMQRLAIQAAPGNLITSLCTRHSRSPRLSNWTHKEN